MPDKRRPKKPSATEAAISRIEKRLDGIARDLRHQHEMLHALAERLACDRHDMTPEDVAAVNKRLNAVAARLAGIAEDAPAPTV